MESIPQPTLRDLQTKPWRYKGYKAFTEWAASDNDYFVIRRFDRLAARVIFLLQWNLTKLETQLAEMDRERSLLVIEDLNNGSFECDDDDRQACIRLIQEKLKEYHDFVVSYSNLKGRPCATSHNISNVKNWMYSNAKAVDPKETQFINDRDLFPIVTTSRTPLRRAFEKFDWFRRSGFFRYEPCGNQDDYYNPETTFHQLDQRIDTVMNILICVTGFWMLVAPLWILLYITTRQYQLAVITIFIAFFLGIVQSVTVARPFESLAATAAYAAVLMVFVQIGPQQGPAPQR